jgi:hypothetical protein
MTIIEADCHPGFQQIGFVDTDTGELQERRLEHREGAETFYRGLAQPGRMVWMVRVGMEASGHVRACPGLKMPTWCWLTLSVALKQSLPIHHLRIGAVG